MTEIEILRRDQQETRAQIPPPPSGYSFVDHGESQPGDLDYCWTHGWEPVSDAPCSVFGYNAVARLLT
jgi:hypothetical protein